VTFTTGAENTVVQNIVVPTFVPGFGLFRCLAILEAAGKEGAGFGVGDIFDWERQLVQVLLGFVLSATWYLFLLYVLDTALISRFARSVSNRVKGIDTDLHDENDYGNRLGKLLLLCCDGLIHTC
jgi:hypothetical protein